MRKVSALVRTTAAAWSATTGVAALAIAASTNAPHRLAHHLTHAIPGRGYLLVAVGSILLLVTADLARGKLAAAWASGGCAGALLATSRATSEDAILAALALLGLLLIGANRRSFAAASDPPRARQLIHILVVGQATAVAYAWYGIVRSREGFVHAPGWRRALGDALGIPLLLPLDDDPITAHARWIVSSSRSASLVLLAIALAAYVRATHADRRPPAPALARAPSLSTRVGQVPYRYPLSCAFIAFQLWVMTTTAVFHLSHDDLLRSLGVDWPLLARGEVWRLLTSPLIQAHAGFEWGNVAMLALFPWAERRLGVRTMAAIYFIGDNISTVVTLLGLRVAKAFDVQGAGTMLAQLDAGTSAGSLAVLVAGAALTSDRRRRAQLVSVPIFGLAALLATGGHLYDIQHLLAAIVGAGAGAVVRRRRAGRLTLAR